MNCKKPSVGKTISREEAIALYNTIDLQLLKEAPISQSDAKELVRNMAKPLDTLPNANALEILDAVNNPAFASLLLYSFIPDGAKELAQNPMVAEKRNKHLKIVDFLAAKSGVDRAYVQKHIRNVLVDAYGKNPEALLHEVSQSKDGLGFLPIVFGAIQAAGSIASLFRGGTPEDKSDAGYQNFINSVDRGSIFPSKEEVITALQGTSAWGDATWRDLSSYNEATGTWKRGDWNQAITSLTPIVVKSFKGSGESFEVATNYNSQALERAYAKQTAPAPTDWSASKVAATSNITKDPAYKPTANQPWYKNPWIIGGGILATGVVGIGTYTLLSDKK